MTTLLHLGILTGTVFLSSRFVPGVKVKSTPAALLVAVVFSVLNFLLGGLIKMALFVPGLLTLGLLFLVLPLIVNAILLWLTDKLLPAFEIETFKGLGLMAVIVTVVNAIFRMAVR